MLFGVMGGLPGSSAYQVAVFGGFVGTQEQWLASLVGAAGGIGPPGATGSQGAAGVNAFGAPVSRSVSLGAAYQASDPTKPAVVTLNLKSTSSNALLAVTQAQQLGEIIIGTTAAAVTGATGTKIGYHENSQGGVLVVGLTITQAQAQQTNIALPIGWYFGVRQTVGSNLSVTSAFDQTVG